MSKVWQWAAVSIAFLVLGQVTGLAVFFVLQYMALATEIVYAVKYVKAENAREEE